MKVFLSAAFLLLCLSATAQTFTKSDAQRCATRSKAVTIIRDSYGVPHIYGKTDADVVFGLMYTEGEDNFKGVERNYLYQLGRQAEADGEDRLIEDLQMKLIADSTAAIREYRTSPPWFKSLLDAFADGLNYYLYKHPETKPLVIKHFEPWYPLMFTDGSVAATNYGDINVRESAQFYNKTVQKLGAAGKPFTREVEDIADRVELGSNGFAIGPSKSASGHAMLYINPHVPFYFRSEVQLVSQQGLNVYGAVTWGQFFVYQGFNQHCGWMHTSSYADVADVYAEQVAQKDGQWVYTYAGEQKPVTVKKITLAYLKDGKQEQKTYQGYLTHHGPVLAEREGKWMALKHNNRSYNALLESWLITKANTFAEYKKAMSLLSNTSNNTVYADDQGNIAFWYGNFMPRRNASLNWREPVDGTTPATEWQGVHALDQIIHVYNPSTGWIQNCNSTPFTSAGAASPLKNQYPQYMAPDGENYRGVTAARLLGAAGKLTLDGLIKTGYNRYLSAFDDLLPPLFKAFEEYTGADKKQLAIPIELLKNWNRISDTTSVATTLGVQYAAQLFKQLPRVMSTESGTYQTERVRAMISYAGPQQFLKALTDAVDIIRSNNGGIAWEIPWGQINRYQRPDDGKFSDSKPSLAAASVASTYGQLPSFVSRQMPGTQKFYGYSGNSFIAAVEFGPRIKAKSIETGGSSFDPKSTNFTDQAKGYLDGNFKEVLFYKEDVLKHVQRTYHP
ncbi:penicillin acylase family protein [Mucilaginibacter ginkgonis]|uniref:Penicillin acylase family protein n=1 Tax=Mucilaginibacter ginkgonis TaxID=2682091 RepID=A0A6I4HU81_9SPHI|nr:penicillin acylase family protein [Mucilaginibacter ginkgonis]QQL50359.1 penicillin acylase family protein [Mucilaginibacter ginkgonis]